MQLVRRWATIETAVTGVRTRGGMEGGISTAGGIVRVVEAKMDTDGVRGECGQEKCSGLSSLEIPVLTLVRVCRPGMSRGIVFRGRKKARMCGTCVWMGVDLGVGSVLLLIVDSLTK